jgi:hypothetical protein
MNLDKWRKYADEPTPDPQAGTWTLTAPDGRTWQADAPMRCLAAEIRTRVPAHVALGRIARSMEEDLAETQRSSHTAGSDEKEGVIQLAADEDRFDAISYETGHVDGWNEAIDACRAALPLPKV